MFRKQDGVWYLSWGVSEIIVSPGNSQLFPADSPCDMISGTPHEVNVVGGRHSMPMFYTLIHHVGKDPKNCPVALWRPKVKAGTDGQFR